DSKIASAKRQRDKAQQDIDITKERLARMEVRAPSSGVIVYLPNLSQGWINAKPFKVGDQVGSGSAIAEIPDISKLALKGKLEEIDRGRSASGRMCGFKLIRFRKRTFRESWPRFRPSWSSRSTGLHRETFARWGVSSSPISGCGRG